MILGSRSAVAALLALAGLGLAAACESPPPAAPTEAPGAAETAPDPADRFSAARAWSDLEALVAVSPSETPSAGEAAWGSRGLAYLSGALRERGVAFEELELAAAAPAEGATPPDGSGARARAVVATLPGESPRLFVLVARYVASADPSGAGSVGPNRGASGAALLLELTRVLSTRPLPYTTHVVWLVTDASGPEPEIESPAGRAMAARMQEDGTLASIRLLVAIDSVCDADLRIARDLGSHRMHRETFFRAAQRLGRAGVFPPAAEFRAVDAAHQPFRERDVRPVVALRGTGFTGDEPAEGEAAHPVDSLARCAPESLESVGVVVLDGLDVIGRRLAKIDRFSRSPLVTDVEALPTPPGEAVAPDALAETAASPDDVAAEADLADTARESDAPETQGAPR